MGFPQRPAGQQSKSECRSEGIAGTDGVRDLGREPGMLGPATFRIEQASASSAGVSNDPQMIALSQLTNLRSFVATQIEQVSEVGQLCFVQFENIRQREGLIDDVAGEVVLAQVHIEDS